MTTLVQAVDLAKVFERLAALAQPGARAQA